MSQQLADYVTARHEAILSVLGMLAAEHQLSDEHSSVIDVTDAERKADHAAFDLANAAGALDMDRRPAGWSEPPAAAGDVKTARRRFAAAALRCVSAQYAPESAHADAEDEHASGQLALAARNLAADAEAQQAARAEDAGRLL